MKLQIWMTGAAEQPWDETGIRGPTRMTLTADTLSFPHYNAPMREVAPDVGTNIYLFHFFSKRCCDFSEQNIKSGYITKCCDLLSW